jgi:hypothetical protein
MFTRVSALRKIKKIFLSKDKWQYNLMKGAHFSDKIIFRTSHKIKNPAIRRANKNLSLTAWVRQNQVLVSLFLFFAYCN